MTIPVQSFPYFNYPRATFEQTNPEIAHGSDLLTQAIENQRAITNLKYLQPELSEKLRKLRIENETNEPAAKYAPQMMEAALQKALKEAPHIQAQIDQIYQGTIPLNRANAGHLNQETALMPREQALKESDLGLRRLAHDLREKNFKFGMYKYANPSAFQMLRTMPRDQKANYFAFGDGANAGIGQGNINNGDLESFVNGEIDADQLEDKLHGVHDDFNEDEQEQDQTQFSAYQPSGLEQIQQVAHQQSYAPGSPEAAKQLENTIVQKILASRNNREVGVNGSVPGVSVAPVPGSRPALRENVSEQDPSIQNVVQPATKSLVDPSATNAKLLKSVENDPYRRANIIAAFNNKPSKVLDRAAFALNNEIYLSNKDFLVPKILNAMKYAGAAGKGKAALDALKKETPDAYADYDWYKNDFVTTMSNNIRNLESLSVDQVQRAELHRMNDMLKVGLDKPHAISRMNDLIRGVRIISDSALDVSENKEYRGIRKLDAGVPSSNPSEKYITDEDIKLNDNKNRNVNIPGLNEKNIAANAEHYGVTVETFKKYLKKEGVI
jgi:hypothetical protein